jgi:hypothetical protein
VTRRRPAVMRTLGGLLVLCTLAWALLHGLDSGVLFMAPALLLLLLLRKGHYLGEQRLIGLMARQPVVRAPRQIAQPRALARCIRGGELLARSLAVRPPPALTA